MPQAVSALAPGRNGLMDWQCGGAAAAGSRLHTPAAGGVTRTKTNKIEILDGGRNGSDLARR